MTRASVGPNHPWRQYPRRRTSSGPTEREIAVAEIMAEEADDDVTTVQKGRKYRGPRDTSERAAARLGMKPSNVRNVMGQIRKRLGHQAR